MTSAAIAARKEPLPDHEDWKDRTDKLKELVR